MNGDPLLVYVAAPRDTGESVLRLHDDLAELGIRGVATWPLFGWKEELDGVAGADRARAALGINDADLAEADVVFFIGRATGGTEALCETARAIEERMAVVWLGERLLSSYRPGVVCVPTFEVATQQLAAWEMLTRGAPPGSRRRILFQAAVDAGMREVRP